MNYELIFDNENIIDEPFSSILVKVIIVSNLEFTYKDSRINELLNWFTSNNYIILVNDERLRITSLKIKKVADELLDIKDFLEDNSTVYKIKVCYKVSKEENHFKVKDVKYNQIDKDCRKLTKVCKNFLVSMISKVVDKSKIAEVSNTEKDRQVTFVKY